ncbi:bifunctional RNase H/acid phosphatase [Streptomyces afghaniensis]|uniref:bifunctional RNase H/acid phosphatase n=1 Tax=Streptomyces afghaniensis TaxID=66865 RepID=UPI00278733CE|nr:bifunctional RNase H/acid phosphatase [Streptomyces afghaniensis]MDQ1019855.1 broad specificity phosphatase PhoE/ribonuclease HI [Streptomyces afghaniensis]
MREFIVEADGGSRGNPGPAGYGAVVSDAATGETLREAAEYLGVATNNVAEYRGLLAGLRAAHELDPAATVHVRMDSKLVIEQMSGRWKIKHPDMKPLAADAARVFPPGRVTYEWIPRERNKHADRLANEAMDAGARGEQWSPSASTADLDTPAATAVPPEPQGPPGDATAGAAKAREALATGGTAESGPSSPAPPSAPGTTERPDADADVAKADTDARTAKAVATPGWAPADMGAPATFVLLRHGETPLTPQKRFSGSGGTDPALSDAGREQAERAAALLTRRGTIQAIVSSPLARTRETAGIVAARLGLDVSVDDGLRETDFGAWEGLTFAEVRERHPDDLNAWLASPDAEPTGGGESFAATATRIAATRDKLVAAYAGRTVLLVTHVTPIKTLVRLALGAPPESLFRMELSAASLSVVAYYADGNASVRLLNDTSHLR